MCSVYFYTAIPLPIGLSFSLRSVHLVLIFVFICHKYPVDIER